MLKVKYLDKGGVDDVHSLMDLMEMFIKYIYIFI